MDEKVMKKYSSANATVEAKRMTRKEYNDFRGWEMPENENGDDEGYLVRYIGCCINETLYVSWLAKDVFESIFKPSDTYLERMSIEMEELTNRYLSATKFISSEKFEDTIPNKAQRDLLVAQTIIMNLYRSILVERALSCNACMLPFSVAVEAMKCGHVISRHAWENKVIIKQNVNKVDGNVIPNMTSLPDKAKHFIINSTESKTIKYINQCLIFDSKTCVADSWSPSTEDIFATDWYIV